MDQKTYDLLVFFLLPYLILLLSVYLENASFAAYLPPVTLLPETLKKYEHARLDFVWTGLDPKCYLIHLPVRTVSGQNQWFMARVAQDR